MIGELDELDRFREQNSEADSAPDFQEPPSRKLDRVLDIPLTPREEEGDEVELEIGSPADELNVRHLQSALTKLRSKDYVNAGLHGVRAILGMLLDSNH